MTDRFYALTVLLEESIREDDCQPLLDAILMLKGVIKVEGHVSDIQWWAAYGKARDDLESKLLKAFQEDKDLESKLLKAFQEDK